MCSDALLIMSSHSCVWSLSFLFAFTGSKPKKRRFDRFDLSPLSLALQRARDDGVAERAAKRKAVEDAVVAEQLRLAEEAAEAEAKRLLAEKKKAEKAQRSQLKEQAVQYIIENKCDIMDGIRHFKNSYNVMFDYKVLARNVASFRAGNGLAHSGPRRIFEPAEVAKIRADQVSRALSKDAVEDGDTKKVLSDLRVDVARERALRAGLDAEDIPGAAHNVVSETSRKKYTPLLLGKKMKANPQNQARAEALLDMYNAISFVVAVRLMYGFIYDDSVTGKLN